MVDFFSGCTLCPNGGQYYAKTKKCYWLVVADGAWGNTACQRDGGDLVVVTDASVNHILVELARDAEFTPDMSYDFWIGLYVNIGNLKITIIFLIMTCCKILLFIIPYDLGISQKLQRSKTIVSKKSLSMFNP